MPHQGLLGRSAIPGAVDDLALLAALARARGAPAAYDRLAPRYDHFHARWLRRGGAETVAALQGCLTAELRPGARVLDAGCGPGTLARWVEQCEPQASLTLLDAAPRMLARATAAVPAATWALGDVTDLPFPDGAFDVILCAWVLETLPDDGARARALAELVRVAAPGGLVCLCVATRPDAWATRLRVLPTRLVMAHCFHGRLLPHDFPGLEAPPGPGDMRVRRLRYHRGLSSLVCVRTAPHA